MPKPTSYYSKSEDEKLLEWLAIPTSTLHLELNQTKAFQEAAKYLHEAKVSKIVRSWESVKKRLALIKPKPKGMSFFFSYHY